MHVQAEFAEEKAREAEVEAPPSDAPSLLPGWGTWASTQRTPGWMASAQLKAQRCCSTSFLCITLLRTFCALQCSVSASHEWRLFEACEDLLVSSGRLWQAMCEQSLGHELV
jgi:hypothetical protein